jgi:hypothetical protein
MEAFQCKRCGYETKTKSNLYKHLRRKKPCTASCCDVSTEQLLSELLPSKQYNEHCFNCYICGAKFNSQSNQSRHTKNCKNKTTQDDINDLKKEIAELKQKLETNNVSANIGTINNITNNHIHLNSYGRETWNHLPKEFLTNCFMMKDIPALIENIYFDEECPENHNVKLKSSKNKTVKIYDDGKWKVRPADRIIDEMVNKGQSILSIHYKNNKDYVAEDMNEDEIDEVVDWLHKIWNDNVKVRKPLKEDIMSILLSYKDE